jgi:proteasome accessory factor B
VPEVALEGQPAEPEGVAVVRLRHGRGHTLRRYAQRTTELDERWAEVEVPYRRGTTERDVAALGTHAVAVSPPELVEGVRSALLAVLGAHASAPSESDPKGEST